MAVGGAGHVSQNVGRTVAVDHHNVDAPVIVEVAKGATSTVRDERSCETGVGHFLEFAAPQSLQELVWFGVWVFGIIVCSAVFHTSVCNIEVEQPVAVEVKKANAESGEWPTRCAWSFRVNPVEKEIVRAKEKSIRLSNQMGDEQVETTSLHEVNRHNSHSRLRHTQCADGTATKHCFVFERPISLVEPQLIRHGVVGHINIEPTILVEVADGHSEAVAICLIQPRCHGDIFERAVAAVMIKRRHGGGLVIHRRAVIQSATAGETLDLAVRRPLDVIRHNQIKMAVAIVIKKGGARAP